jgi:hypothetical protein
MNNKLENAAKYEILGHFKVLAHNGPRRTEVHVLTSFSVLTATPLRLAKLY